MFYLESSSYGPSLFIIGCLLRDCVIHFVGPNTITCRCSVIVLYISNVFVLELLIMYSISNCFSTLHSFVTFILKHRIIIKSCTLCCLSFYFITIYTGEVDWWPSDLLLGLPIRRSGVQPSLSTNSLWDTIQCLPPTQSRKNVSASFTCLKKIVTSSHWLVTRLVKMRAFTSRRHVPRCGFG